MASLIDEVRRALGHLHDVHFLQAHPLARQQLVSGDAGPLARGRLLQSRLLAAIDQLSPAEAGPRDSRLESRYEVLRLRFVERLDVLPICLRLGISRSEYYRRLGEGLDAVATQLQASARFTPTLDLGGDSPAGRDGPGSTLQARLRSPFAPPTVFVGRERELEELKAEYAATASGRGGRAVLISGEQGIGKTRLGHELGQYVRQQGGLFLSGRWSAWEGAAPYGAVADALRQGLGQLDPEDVARVVGPYARELHRVFPEVVPSVEPPATTSEINVEEDRLRLYDAVASLVGNLARAQPLVLFLDDLHLAPQMNLQLYIARRLPELPVLMIQAFREDELVERQPLVAGRNELIRSRLVNWIRLQPLSEADTGEIIAHAFDPNAAEDLRAPVHAVANGNPFFLEELLRYLVETAAVRAGPEGWEVQADASIGIPESVRFMVLERVARLGDQARALMEQAAVLGTEFSFASLNLMVDDAGADLVRCLDQTIAAGLVVDKTLPAEERYGFQDEHVREIVYESTPIARRRRYHLRAGAAIEALHPQRLEELAYHFTQGHDPARGADYCHRAASKAASLHVWSRAIPLYSDALDLWDELGGQLPEVAAICEELGDACYKSGIEAQKGLSYFERALGLYERLGNSHKVATIHSRLGREYMSSANLAVRDQTKALEHLDQARQLLETEQERSTPLGLVYCGLALGHHNLLHWPETISWAQAALNLGEQIGSPALIANACAPLGLAYARMSDVIKGIGTLERGWEVAVEHQLGFQADMIRAYAIRVCGVALKSPNTGLTWLRRQPDFHTIYSELEVQSQRITLYALGGNLIDGRRAMAELQSALETHGQPRFGPWPSALGGFWTYCGEWDRAASLLDEGLAWAVRGHDTYVQARVQLKLGELYLELGDDEVAAEFLSASLQLFRAANDVLGEVDILPRLIEANARLGKWDVAHEDLDRARTMLAGLPDWAGVWADFHLAEALLAAAQDDWETAEAAFTRAAGACKGCGLMWDQARVLEEWGGALAARPAADGSHRRAAASLLREARALWDAMGVPPYAERCAVKLASLN